MAIKPAENEAFFREVDEELRRAQVTSFWRRYGRWLIGAALIGLIGVALYLWWQEHRAAQAGKFGETLVASFDDVEARKYDAARNKLASLEKEGTPGYRAAAGITLADIALESGKEADAVAAFKKVAEDATLPEPYRNAALVRQTALEFDTLPPATVIARLRPLAIAGNPWFGSAGELVAMAHLKQNRRDLAAPIFAAMARDNDLPESLHLRAIQMSGALGIDAVEEPAATKEGNP